MLGQSTSLELRDSAPDRTQMTQGSSAPPPSLLRAARRCAMRELGRAPACNCCESLLLHLLGCLGSTLFYDEDPTRLWRTLNRRERSLVTPRVLAACIALQGRERQDLYPPSSSPTWPALHLLVAPDPASDTGHLAASAEDGMPAACEELQSSVQRLIAEAQQHAGLNPDARLRRTLAYLWAAADLLEGRSK